MPTEQLGKTTRLSAVNSMLAALGESPATDLASPTRSDVNAAVDLLDSTSREVQGRGWFWNTELQTFNPDTSNRITISQTVLNVDAAEHGIRDQVIERGGMLYSLHENSYEFSAPIDLIVVTHLPFEAIPESARNYIARRASRILQENRVGDPSLVKYAERLEAEGLYLLQEMESSNGDYSSFRNSTVASLYRMRGI